MRVLFVLGYPGYLRYYDSTIHLLAERGHDVVCVFEQPAKQSEGLTALEGANERIVVKATFPRRSVVLDRLPRETRRVADWVRYLDPRFEEADYLRERAADAMLPPFRALRGISTLPSPISGGLMRGMLSLERHLPAYPEVRTFLAEEKPDVVVVTPLVTSASRQPDVVKAAQEVGIPTVLGVASWDHLTSKGLIRVLPDRVLVWNGVQRNEAEDLHAVSPERIRVTGAQPWDRWFGRRPTRSVEQFCREAGLPPDRRFVLFVGSTASISAPRAEIEFVREWVQALRRSSSASLRELAVLVRPHPYNSELWSEADLSDLGAVSVYPRAGANPVDEDDRSTYFDSMYFSSAVVGINTSAMIESAIVGRPVLTIRSPRFSDSQGGTMHFHYMLSEKGGFVRTAETLDEHAVQLDALLRHPGAAEAELERFVREFVRPHGLERPATPFVVDAIEDMMYGGQREPQPMPLRRKPLSYALWALGAASVLTDRAQVGRMLVATATPTRRRLEQGALAFQVSGRRTADEIRRVGDDGRSPKLVGAADRLERAGVRASEKTNARARAIEKAMKQKGKAIFSQEREKTRLRKAVAAAEKERRRSEGPGYTPTRSRAGAR